MSTRLIERFLGRGQFVEEGLDILGKGKKKSEEIAGGEKLDEQSS